MKPAIDYGIASFIIGYHLALLIGLPLYFMYDSPSWGICLSAGILLYVTGLSVTAGYHRLYAHSTYKTNKWMEAIFLFFATMATQGSALKWACDHRRHHAFVDTDRDPYSIKKGFWHAHVFWLFRKTDPIDKKIVADLCKNRLVAFQHRFYVPLMFLTNTLAFLFVGYLCNDYLGAFIFTWWVRLFFLHHLTWFINSLAHTWGAQAFSQEHSAVDNYVISLLTFGEGYHNYHHTFANDYRNGIRWFHFDPTKWVIWLLSKCRLAYGLRKISHLHIKEKLVIERKNELVEKIKHYWFINKTLVEEVAEKITADILAKFSKINQLLIQCKSYKSEGEPNRDVLDKLTREIKALKKSLKSDWKRWQKFSKRLLNLRPPRDSSILN